MADFNDELSEEEETKLRELSEAHEPPAVSSEGEDADPPAPASADDAAAAAAAAAEAGAGGEPAANVTDVNAEADADAKDDFDAFAAKHKGRSPEELLKLAFQKEQARKSARFDAKQARDIVTDLRDGLQKRAADRAASQAAERKKFDETLEQDPDKAATMAFERQQQREREEAEEHDWKEYVATQTEICVRSIPNFQQVAPEMMQFGVEKLGYEPQQVQNAHDSRDMIALYMASRFGRLIDAGVVDFEGRLLDPSNFTPANTGGQGGGQRPMRQAPRTLSAAPGAGGGGAKSLKDQAAELLNMSDEDFDKAVNAGSFDQTVRSLAGGDQ